MSPMYSVIVLIVLCLNAHICFTAPSSDLWNSLILYSNNSLDSASTWNCSDKCSPGHTSIGTQCNYIKTCCNDTLSDGALVNYLTMQYCFFNTVQPLGVGVLTIFVFYAFLMLGNVADDYFAPTMAELADFLGVSHELAGVTFVALGNGAPDISSSVAAITQGGDTTKLGLGALLGAAVFDPIVVSGAIAVIVNNPKVARRPFLRDCFFLFIAAGCVLFITSDGKVVIAEALGMVMIYVFYVGSVLLGEIYKKLRKKKRREAKERRKTSLDPAPETITDKMIMPVLGAFSNDSMRDLFESKSKPKPKTVNSITCIQQNSPLFSTDSPLSRVSRQESTEIPYIQDLYHQLEQEEHRKHSHKNDKNENAKQDDDNHSVSSASSFDMSSSSSSSDDDEEVRVWWQTLLLYILRGPTLLVEILCKITIPLTDKNWNDWTAISSCITAPIFIQFAFLPDSIFTLIGGQIPIVAIVAFIGCLLAAFTFWRVKIKYRIYNRKKQEKQQALLGGELTGAYDIDGDISHKSMTASITTSMIGGSGPSLDDVNKSSHSSGILHSSTSVLINSQVLNTSKNKLKQVEENMKDMDSIEDDDYDYDDDDEDMNGLDEKEKKKRRRRKKTIDLTKEPVMKLFFLLLGFLSAVAWIEIVANELVNLLTTLGVLSTIDLALLGLTVLAWGNSIGDLIADVSVSKRGYAKMGISAAIGGPTLNVLIGVGLGTTINTLSASDGVDHMPDTSNIFVCCIAVMLGIGIYAIWIAITKWTLKKGFGYFCFVYYGAFLVINILVYENVIPLPFGS